MSTVAQAPQSPLTQIPINVSERERVASIAGGVVAAGAALVQRSAVTPFLFFAAGYLIRRGVTGRCRIYDILRLNTAPAKNG